MTELTHDETPDDGFHEIQLSGKQLVFLFMAGTVMAVLIFLCGVQVGRGVRSDRGPQTDASDSLASAAPAAASTPSQPVASSGPPAAEPPAPAAEPADDLSYAKRLQSDAQPSEKLKPQATATEPPAPKATEPARPARSAAAPAAASAGRPGPWIVQVISLQDRSAAAGIAQRLGAKGYPAFVLDPAPGAPRIFRVQVGGYADKNEAEQASRRLERDEQLKPLVRAR